GCIGSATRGWGKTLFLDVLGRLLPRAQRTLNVTPAAFRVIEEYQPTLLIDEADTFLNNDDLRGILNGNRKGDTVLRTVGDNHEVRAFATYAAVAIAKAGARWWRRPTAGSCHLISQTRAVAPAHGRHRAAHC